MYLVMEMLQGGELLDAVLEKVRQQLVLVYAMFNFLCICACGCAFVLPSVSHLICRGGAAGDSMMLGARCGAI